MSYPNKQNMGAGAIPVWFPGGGAPVPPGSAIVEYVQVEDLSSAVPLTAPEGADVAVVQVNAGIVRYRRDGVAPTGDVGMLLYATGPNVAFYAPFDDLEFIQKTGSTASLNIEWWNSNP